MPPATSKPIWINILGLMSLLFGLITVLKGGSTLFTNSGQEQAGAVVPAVLWFNFIAGFFYIVAGVAIFREKSCAKKLSILLAASSVMMALVLIIHIANNNPYEQRTVFAMALRTIYWIVIAAVLFRSSRFRQDQHKCQCAL